jgi:hypothetical protein
VLAYLSRYTHRVAISNHRLIAFDKTGVTFRYKDYRRDAAAVAWSSSRSFSLPLKRAPRLHRLPLPASRCRDSSQRISSYRRSCGASAVGWPRTRLSHQLLHRADDDQISLPAVVASRQSRALRPTAPPGATTQRLFAVAAPTARAHRNLQIPIAFAAAAGSCLGGFRTPAHAQTSDLRWPAPENLHHVGRHWPDQVISEPDIRRSSVQAAERQRSRASERRMARQSANQNETRPNASGVAITAGAAPRRPRGS